MVAHVTNHTAVKLVIDIGDAHIYSNQVELVKEQISREPSQLFDSRVVFADNIKEMKDFNMRNIIVKGYDLRRCQSDLRYPVAV